MRPRTKLEKAVAELNATLSEDIAVADAKWAGRQCKKWDMTHFCYFTITTNIREWEVKRLYRIYKFTDKSTDHLFFVEIIREFFDGSNRLFFAKHRQMGMYYDCFTYDSDIELRGIYKNYCCYDLTQLFSLSMESRSQSRGKRIPCDRINPKELARIICNNPVAENLYKQRDPLFVYLIYQLYNKEVCRAITIAKRHGFVFDNYTTSLWFDMVRAMVYCKQDWHNPVYIVPKDLLATHDRFVKMQERKRQEAKVAAKMRKAEKKTKSNIDYEALYNKNRKRFFDMVLTDGLITIKVLPSIAAFLDEATEMHHCVYSNEYWNMHSHKHSLIMSATIGGHRCETIEINLNTFQIMQCYGKYNKFTNYHQRILDLLKKKMRTIKAYASGSKENKHKKAA